ncbi:uncharacterized protein LOC144447601 [Glandiceps talaboti]
MANFLGVWVSVLVIGYVSALTDEQVAKFKPTGITESNTGLIGTITITTADDKHVIESNGIPDHDTATFPNLTNPNSLQSQSHHFEVPVTPTEATEPSCLPMGPIGVAVNGVPIFNPFTIEGNNAVEGEYAEVFDDCDGHPAPQGDYHYHKAPSCVIDRQSETSPIIGVALDGYAIYGPTDEDGNTLTTDDLDACHGRTVNGVYQYHITADFPYYLGCFKGEPLSTSGLKNSQQCYFATGDGSGVARPEAAFTIMSIVSIFVIMLIN